MREPFFCGCYFESYNNKQTLLLICNYSTHLLTVYLFAFFFSVFIYVIRWKFHEIGQHSHLSGSLHPAHAHMHGGWYASGMGALSAGSGLQSGFSSGGLAGGVVPHSQSYHLMVSNHAIFFHFYFFICNNSHTSFELNNYLPEYVNCFDQTLLNSRKSLQFQCKNYVTNQTQPLM